MYGRVHIQNRLVMAHLSQPKSLLPILMRQRKYDTRIVSGMCMASIYSFEVYRKFIGEVGFYLVCVRWSCDVGWTLSHYLCTVESVRKSSWTIITAPHCRWSMQEDVASQDPKHSVARCHTSNLGTIFIRPHNKGTGLSDDVWQTCYPWQAALICSYTLWAPIIASSRW